MQSCSPSHSKKTSYSGRFLGLIGESVSFLANSSKFFQSKIKQPLLIYFCSSQLNLFNVFNPDNYCVVDFQVYQEVFGVRPKILTYEKYLDYLEDSGKSQESTISE